MLPLPSDADRGLRDGRGTAGFTLAELLVVVAVLGIVSALALPGLHYVLRKSHVNAVAAEAKHLYHAFTLYFIDHNRYPNATSAPAFQLDTFEPLRSAGYYRGDPGPLLQGGRAQAYDSPDDRGTNQEFWLILVPRGDPSASIIVAASDDVPLVAGTWLDGVFLYQNGVLKPIQDYR